MVNKETWSTRYARPELHLGFRSRCVLVCLRWIVRPLLAFVIRGGERRVAKAQLNLAARFPRNGQLANFDYQILGDNERAVPGHILGEPFAPSDKPVLLWLHGGAFVLPALPDGHLTFVQRLCRSLDADAFVPDYRLAPANPYPAGLDDCERAYRFLLNAGIDPQRIVIGGESAGGNLLVALLFRIRKAGLPMPACAVPVSPVLDLARLHGAASRSVYARTDAMLPLADLARARDWYVGEADASCPEISPLMGECKGLPPLLIFSGSSELLADDSALLARKASAAGVEVELAQWPGMPHAFPLLEDWMPEARQARDDMTAFIKQHLTDNRNTEIT
ncbi:alpha/beta hydrolase [Marinobacter sp. chi1]|uniref:Alpha/beta hydrolase n=1 Tax=Marinobacter suaedae TaxID=3057675 RepID=A0ABT8W0F4_9GAMM|nr:alpha/beta hydrolase [Marinobacter sp. chi1]MDO3721661.1 alpha/beta hydrolase [Marinobacter sp. chi1]